MSSSDKSFSAFSVFSGFSVWHEAKPITHAVIASLTAVLLLAIAISMTGWNSAGMLIAGAIVLISLRTVMVVNLSLNKLHLCSSATQEETASAEQHYISVLQRVTRYAELREGRDIGRSERVGKLCEEIASRQSIPANQCRLMNLAGQLHDIGLLTVPEHILRKSSQLSGNEFISVKKHAEASCEILKPLAIFKDVLDGIKHHHERLNGSGYPDGLKGDELSTSAKILAVADVFEAMTHDRPHRPAINAMAAISELRRCCPDGFDSKIVESLAEIKHAPIQENTLATCAK